VNKRRGQSDGKYQVYMSSEGDEWPTTARLRRSVRVTVSWQAFNSKASAPIMAWTWRGVDVT
jgi:hypothetical protein